MRILLAVDGSPCSRWAVDEVAARPWPRGTAVEILSVAHTRWPLIPEPTFMLIASREEALEEQRKRAETRVVDTGRRLTAAAGHVDLSTKVIDGDPEKEILAEAARWDADLIVMGTHGRSLLKRLLLGSVSAAVALHAPCSVEIVRQPRHQGAQ